MISSSVVYGHSVKYSYEILHEYLLLMVISLLAYVATFSDSFIFGKATSSHFFRITFFKLPQELLFQTSSFLRAASFFEIFRNSHFFSAFFFFFFRIAAFSDRNFCRETTPQEQEILQRSYLLEQISTEDIYRRATFSKQILLHNINFFKKARSWKKLLFQKSNILHYLLILESCLFNAFFINHCLLFSKELFFYNMPIQKSYYFRGTLLHHGYNSH